ncbi:hypothetical protein D3C80_1368520 [compost metagenome]
MMEACLRGAPPPGEPLHQILFFLSKWTAFDSKLIVPSKLPNAICRWEVAGSGRGTHQQATNWQVHDFHRSNFETLNVAALDIRFFGS